MGYRPKQGDIVYLNFDPQLGHEQAGRRPAVVVSNVDYGVYTRGMAVVCPITNTDRAFPLHVKLDSRTKSTGVILCEQVKAIDVEARDVTYREKIPQDILEEVIDILISFIEI